MCRFTSGVGVLLILVVHLGSALASATEPETLLVAGVPIVNYQNRYYTAKDQNQETDVPVTDWIIIFKVTSITDAVAHDICHARGKCLAVGDPVHGGVAFALVQATDDELQDLLQTYGQHIDYVEPDAPMELIADEDANSTMDVLSKVASWGLDRIDDRNGLDGSYNGDASGGAGVHVYVADTGIRTTHQTFGGRAFPAIDVTGGNLVDCACDVDCALDRHGHGTHCAGTIGGNEFGVARGVTLHAVKVLNDRGSGSWSGFVQALDWVASHGSRPAVVSASLGGNGRQSSVGRAVESATKAGVTVVVAAGNSRGDACNYSPAYAPSALTIGATDSKDNRAGFSNYGKCLDLFAPGVSITSAWSGGDKSTKTISGTSMACPHVSGAAALLLQADPSTQPSEIASKLKSQATAGVVKDPRNGSPNLLLFVNTSVPPLSTTTVRPASTTAPLCTTTTTTTTTTSTIPLTPASGFCGFESSAQPYCGIWRENKLDQLDWNRKRGDRAHSGSYYLTMSCEEVTIFIDLMYDGTRPGASASGVTVKANGMEQNFVFHPRYPGGAARTTPGFGNQNIGFTPAANVFHHFVLTLRKSNRHTFQIKNGEHIQQMWSKDFDREGLFSDVGGIDVLAWTDDAKNEVMVPGRVYTRDSNGKHSAKLLATPSCKGSEIQSNEDANLEALTPVLRPGAFLSFFYHMKGGMTGVLKVKVRSTKTNTVHELWSKYEFDRDAWTHQIVSLDQFSGESVIVSLVATSPGSSASGEGLAIDDVMLSTEPFTGNTTTVTTTTITTSTALQFKMQIKQAGGQGCLKSNGRGKLLQKGATSGCATFLVLGKQFKSVDVPGQCLDYFAGRGWGLWFCHNGWNQQLRQQSSKWCVKSECVEQYTVATTLTTSTTTASVTTTNTSMSTTMMSTTTAILFSTTTNMSTTTNVSTTTNMSTTTPVDASIQSGDTVFLRTLSGKGGMIDIQGSAVQSRWVAHGNWQAISIEKENGGSINSGDIVFLKTHTGAYIDVSGNMVQARWNEKGEWQSLVVEKRAGDGPILPGEIVCFRAHTGNHVDVEGAVVQARWQDCGDWQSMQIEKEVVGAVFSGSAIHLLAHTGKRIEVEGAAVQARWDEPGTWQTFEIENYGGRAIFSGDAVFLKAHTGMMVDVQGVAVQSRWSEKGAWQQLRIQKKDGSGAIFPGDNIFLQAHTGKFIEVQGHAVRARFSDQGDWQTLTIEKKENRRLFVIDSTPEALALPVKTLAIMAVALVSLAAMKQWQHNAMGSYKVQPVDDCVDVQV